jgi:hypothetical protein
MQSRFPPPAKILPTTKTLPGELPVFLFQPFELFVTLRKVNLPSISTPLVPNLLPVRVPDSVDSSLTLQRQEDSVKFLGQRENVA